MATNDEHHLPGERQQDHNFTVNKRPHWTWWTPARAQTRLVQLRRLITARLKPTNVTSQATSNVTPRMTFDYRKVCVRRVFFYFAMWNKLNVDISIVPQLPSLEFPSIHRHTHKQSVTKSKGEIREGGRSVGREGGKGRGRCWRIKNRRVSFDW